MKRTSDFNIKFSIVTFPYLISGDMMKNQAKQGLNVGS